MSLSIASLNSGSNGNCYYVGNDTEAILVDAGISCRETERRMKRLGLDMQRIKAVFISHEHSDHIKGLESLVKKYSLPVFITLPTIQHGRLCLPPSVIQPFKNEEEISFGSFSVIPFQKFHDAADPYSFVIRSGTVCVGVFTDIGRPCDRLTRFFKECHAAFLESNYDEAMLERGSYPFHLKKRIRGGMGHLSNMQALDLFLKHRPPFMSRLILSHLSQNNNAPDIVESLFRQHAGRVQVTVASRYEESPLFEIAADLPAPVQVVTRRASSFLQLALSFD